MPRTNPVPEQAPATRMGFQTTHWSVVLAAREEDTTVAQEALASLYSTYWYPLYAFIRRQGSNADEAEDLIQEFFYRFIERNPLANVHPAAGKFRTFLLACLKNFLANQRERAHAQRRGGGHPVAHLDTSDGDARYSLEPADNLTPEVMFERRWAFAVLEWTLAELRREYAGDEKLQQFEELQGFLPGGLGNISRAELAAARGVTEGAIDVAVHRLRQRFGTLLREQIAQTVSSESEIEEEIRYLISVIGR